MQYTPCFYFYFMYTTCCLVSMHHNALAISSRDLLFSLIIRISSIQHQQLHKLLPKQWSMFVQGAEILRHRLWTGIMTTAVMGKQPVNATLCRATFMTQVSDSENIFVACFPTLHFRSAPVMILYLLSS